MTPWCFGRHASRDVTVYGVDPGYALDLSRRFTVTHKGDTKCGRAIRMMKGE